MSKHVATKTPYFPQLRNSLGQFLRSLERLVHTSAFIIPEHKNNQGATVSPSVRRPGLTYRKA